MMIIMQANNDNVHIIIIVRKYSEQDYNNSGITIQRIGIKVQIKETK